MSLRERIVHEIRERGSIPFSRYMEMCLYEPGLGFYARSKEQFGKTGDFYTSSDVHAVFGRLLARQFDEMWRTIGAPSEIEIVELGPGRGLFAQDVLAWAAKKFWDFRDALKYRLVEASPSLRERLQSQFADLISEGKVSVCGTIEELPPPEGTTIVFANEFFDALPIEVIGQQGELRICEQNSMFTETFSAPTEQELKYLDLYGIHPGRNERVEARLIDESHMKSFAERVRQGFVVIIDYGYTREELLVGKHRGTVMAFHRHTISNTPYEAPGDQDITAHVNFSALREFARVVNLEILGFVTQAQFLMGIGEMNQFDDAFTEVSTPQERAKVTLQLKHLIVPEAMGEAFDVLVLGKGIDKEKAAQLSGLRYLRR